MPKSGSFKKQVWWSDSSFRLMCPNPTVLENKYGGAQSNNWLYALTCFCLGIFCEHLLLSTMVGALFGHIL
jgi:hypothetical protein